MANNIEIFVSLDAALIITPVFWYASLKWWLQKASVGGGRFHQRSGLLWQLTQTKKWRGSPAGPIFQFDGRVPTCTIGLLNKGASIVR
jgi:hypothetical protein